MKKCIGGHAKNVKCTHCTVDPVRTGNGVPRNALGWPLMDPEEMTDDQLRREAGRWRRTAMSTGPGTVGHNNWLKYADAYVSRGLATPEQVRNYEELPCWHLWMGWTNIEVCELCEETRVLPDDPGDQVSKRSWLDAIKWWK